MNDLKIDDGMMGIRIHPSKEFLGKLRQAGQFMYGAWQCLTCDWIDFMWKKDQWIGDVGTDWGFCGKMSLIPCKDQTDESGTVAETAGNSPKSVSASCATESHKEDK